MKSKLVKSFLLTLKVSIKPAKPIYTNIHDAFKELEDPKQDFYVDRFNHLRQ